MENYVESIRQINNYIALASSPGLKAHGYWLRGFYYYWIGCFETAIEDNFEANAPWKPLGYDWGIVVTDLIIGCIYYDKGA